MNKKEKLVRADRRQDTKRKKYNKTKLCGPTSNTTEVPGRTEKTQKRKLPSK